MVKNDTLKNFAQEKIISPGIQVLNLVQSELLTMQNNQFFPILELSLTNLEENPSAQTIANILDFSKNYK